MPNELYTCDQLECSVWGEIRRLIDTKVYTADDGAKYGITATLIDAGYVQPVVVEFCKQFDSAQGVFPILGRDRPANNQRVSEFGEWETQDKTIGYRIFVDHYKDRLAPALRGSWFEDSGQVQPYYHFNAPVDTTDSELKELTVETIRERVNETSGVVSYYWYRPGNARNELWDLLVYGSAAVEIVAWNVCIKWFELEEMNWPHFWGYIEEQQAFFKLPDTK